MDGSEDTPEVFLSNVHGVDGWIRHGLTSVATSNGSYKMHDSRGTHMIWDDIQDV